jgi:hypothetical protein
MSPPHQAQQSACQPQQQQQVQSELLQHGHSPSGKKRRSSIARRMFTLAGLSLAAEAAARKEAAAAVAHKGSTVSRAEG